MDDNNEYHRVCDVWIIITTGLPGVWWMADGQGLVTNIAKSGSQIMIKAHHPLTPFACSSFNTRVPHPATCRPLARSSEPRFLWAPPRGLEKKRLCLGYCVRRRLNPPRHSSVQHKPLELDRLRYTHFDIFPNRFVYVL